MSGDVAVGRVDADTDDVESSVTYIQGVAAYSLTFLA